MAWLTDPAWTASRRDAGTRGIRASTLSPQGATATMVRVVLGTMRFSAMSVSFPVSEPRKGEPSEEGDREPCEQRTGCPQAHGALFI